jgi:hypothetical protein
VCEQLPVLDATVDDLVSSVSQTRQTLMELQRRIASDMVLFGIVGEALVLVSESLRVLLDIQRRLAKSVRDDT